MGGTSGSERFQCPCSASLSEQEESKGSLLSAPLHLPSSDPTISSTCSCPFLLISRSSRAWWEGGSGCIYIWVRTYTRIAFMSNSLSSHTRACDVGTSWLSSEGSWPEMWWGERGFSGCWAWSRLPLSSFWPASFLSDFHLCLFILSNASLTIITVTHVHCNWWNNDIADSVVFISSLITFCCNVLLSFSLTHQWVGRAQCRLFHSFLQAHSKMCKWVFCWFGKNL